MVRSDLNNWFSYHKPNENQSVKYRSLRRFTRLLARKYFSRCCDCEERTIAIQKLREAVMWINAGIACNEVEEKPFNADFTIHTERKLEICNQRANGVCLEAMYSGLECNVDNHPTGCKTFEVTKYESLKLKVPDSQEDHPVKKLMKGISEVAKDLQGRNKLIDSDLKYYDRKGNLIYDPKKYPTDEETDKYIEKKIKEQEAKEQAEKNKQATEKEQQAIQDAKCKGCHRHAVSGNICNGYNSNERIVQVCQIGLKDIKDTEIEINSKGSLKHKGS